MTSSRFEALERRCEKLKKRRIMRSVSVLTLLFLGMFSLFYLFIFSENVKTKYPLIGSNFLGERVEDIRSLELFLRYINSKEPLALLNFYKGQE